MLRSRIAIGNQYDVPGTWRARAPHARCRALDCGHFLAEEPARHTTDTLLDLLPA